MCGNLNGLKLHCTLSEVRRRCSRKLSYRHPFVFYTLIHRNRTIISDGAAGVNDTAQITLIERTVMLQGRKKIHVVVSHHPFRVLIGLNKWIITNYNVFLYRYILNSIHVKSKNYSLVSHKICNLIILIKKSFNKFKINISERELNDKTLFL